MTSGNERRLAMVSEGFVSAAYQAESRRIMRMLRDGPPPDREPQARIILPMSADGLRAVLSALPADAQVYDGVEGRELWAYWGGDGQ